MDPETSGARSEVHGAVRRQIVERLDARRSVAVADCQDRRVEDLVLDVVPDLRDLLEPARHLAYVRPGRPPLCPEEASIVISQAREPAGIHDRKKGRCLRARSRIRDGGPRRRASWRWT